MLRRVRLDSRICSLPIKRYLNGEFFCKFITIEDSKFFENIEKMSCFSMFKIDLFRFKKEIN